MSTTPPAGRPAPATKVHLSVPGNYWELPEDQRLAEAGKLATAIQRGLR